MERLTEKAPGCFEYSLKDHKAFPGEFGTYDAFFDYSKAVQRLGHYEDTGLEPEEIKELCSDDVAEAARMFRKMIESGEIDHLKDLIQAEQDGRLVVLPCKAGDHVWVDGREAIVEEFFGYETERYLHAQFYDNMQYIDIPFEEFERGDQTLDLIGNIHDNPDLLEGGDEE